MGIVTTGAARSTDPGIDTGIEILQNSLMRLTRQEMPILGVNLLYIPFFTFLAWRQSNQEFLLYVLVILVAGGLVVWNQSKIRFDRVVLWGLTLWGLMHMAGGNIRVGDGVLYSLQLVPIAPQHQILRYDQVVHFFGFGVATLVAHHLLRPFLRSGIPPKATMAFLVVLMGCGFGALNEVIEFIAVLALPETGVGGYENTMWDLVFNLFGSVTVAVWLRLSGRLGQTPGAL